MGLAAHGHRSQHPGTAPARCLHSHRAPNGTATVGPPPLQETQLFGWEPDQLGRVREPVWLNLPVATILAGLTRLIVISSWIAAGPTRAGLDGGNHCGRLALPSSGRASSRDHGSDCRGACYLSDESMVVAHLPVCRVDPTAACPGIWTPFSAASNEHRRLDRHCGNDLTRSQYAAECLACGGLLPGRGRIGQSGASTTSCPSGSTCTPRASERGRSPTGTSSGLSGCVSAFGSGHAPHPGTRVVPEDAASHSEARADDHLWRECTHLRSSNWISLMGVSILCGATHILRPCVKERASLPQSR